MLSLSWLLMSLNSLNSVSCQSTADDDMKGFTAERCSGDEFRLHLTEQLADVTKQLELMQTGITAYYTDSTRYYDIQFQGRPMIVNKPRQQLTAELAALCNPLLIQQNLDGSDFFDRTWAEFKAGFNGSNGSYWLGNELLHQLTVTGRYKLRFDLQSRDNSQWYWAEYSWVTVHNESTGYQLQVGEFTGNVYSDALTDGAYNGTKFTTRDRDNDMSLANCATVVGGGFWHNRWCGWCGVNAPSQFGMFRWSSLTNNYDYLQTSRMWLMCR
jgi:hypothetical protein